MNHLRIQSHVDAGLDEIVTQLIKNHDLQVAPEINHYMYAGKNDIA
jgi:hypothetical protein